MKKKAVASGDFVAQYLNDGDVPEAQIQPNGVDLTVGEIYRTRGHAKFTEAGYEKPDRIKMSADQGYYLLHSGQYPIVYGEEIEIPPGYVGRVYPRSRLMRSGLHLTSALWDQEYEGIGEGLLRIPRSINTVEITPDLPIAQMMFISAESERTYYGTHQGERLAYFDELSDRIQESKEHQELLKN